MRHAIVGTGYGYSVHLGAFKAQRNVDVVAICDGGSGRAAQIAPKGTVPYSDWVLMLDEQRPDSISIATPPASQLNIVSTALKRGIHVLCEKPFGLNAIEAEEMVLAQVKSGCIGSVGYQFRYEAGILGLKTNIEKGIAGNIRKLDVSWITAGRADQKRPWSWQNDARKGGGVINAYLTHVLDLLHWILSVRPSRVTGSSRILIPHRLDQGGKKRQVTAEDQVDIILEFGSHVVANLRISNCQPGGQGMCIEAFGDSGRIVYNHKWPFGPEDASLKYLSRNASQDLPFNKYTLASDSDSRLISGKALVHDYCVSIQTGEPPVLLPLFRDGLRVRRTLGMLN